MSIPTVATRVGAAVAFAATVLLALLANPAAADAPTTPTAATAVVVLIDPICATTDPVAFPCPAGVPTTVVTR